MSEWMARVFIALCVVSMSLGCEQKKSSPLRPPSASSAAPTSPAAPAKTSPAAPEPPSTPPKITRHPGNERVVAIGDVHGDLGALKRSLSLAGLIDAQDRWSGGKQVLVQTGDLLDRGDDEIEIMAFLYILREQARSAGGDIVLMLGNHETMNARGDLRYVTPGGFEDFAKTQPPSDPNVAKILEKFPEQARGRMAAFIPGGPYAQKLATHQVIAVVGDSVFVHGGVLPKHVDYGVDKINREVKDWLQGKGQFPAIMASQDSPLWVRLYSRDEQPGACDVLAKTLEKMGAERMIVGHTPQMGGITSACDGKVWRIDVGMAAHYGGEPAALEIVKGNVRVLSTQQGSKPVPAQK